MQFKLKIFKKYFSITATIILISLFFMLTTLSFFFNNFVIEEKRNSLSKCCQSVAELSRSYEMSEKDIVPVMAYLSPIISKTIDADMLITNTGGEALFCSCEHFREYGNCPHTDKKVSERILKQTVGEDEFYEVGNFDEQFSDTKYVYGHGIKNKAGNDIALVYAFASTSTITRFFSNMLRMLLMTTVVTIVIMFFVVYFVSYKMVKPLTLMSEAAHCMANGDFSRRIPVTGEDEVSELAASFNHMTDALVQLESTRRSFIANVSHELRTPMTTIGGFIDGIIDGTIPEERRNEYLGIVSNEVKRLSRLVQSMLSLAKLESGEMNVNLSDFDLTSTVINIVISQQQRIENKNINIVGLDKLESTVLRADSDLIYQVVYNLVDNAVKFTDDGGEISFTVSSTEKDVCFKIRNTGRGISQKDLPYVFERFYKSDRARSQVKESTGLGLYIVKTIIDIHGGSITVRSKPDNYTEFEFHLPKGN